MHVVVGRPNKFFVKISSLSHLSQLKTAMTKVRVIAVLVNRSFILRLVKYFKLTAKRPCTRLWFVSMF